MYKKITYFQWLDYYANKCNDCHGSKMLIKNGSPVACFCQHVATAKYRLEQVDISPSHLRYTSWEDFTGLVKKGEKVEGSLNVSSAISGRDMAFRYCFNVPYDKRVSKSVSELKVHENLTHGTNVVIYGPPNSGKTLLAALILKEVNRSILNGHSLEYGWARFSDIIYLASWSCNKEIDYKKLEYYSRLPFLFIDGIDIHKGGHNSPPDHIAINSMFGKRRVLNLPSIFVCSEQLLQIMRNNSDVVSSYFGEEFTKLVSEPTNVVIILNK